MKRSVMVVCTAALVAVLLTGCELIRILLDSNPPAEVGALAAVAGDESVTLTWRDPADEDLEQIVIQVFPGSSEPDMVYFGIEEYTATDLAFGEEYEFLVRTVDESGNTSEGVTALATPLLNKIAFVSDRDGNSEIYTMNAADGSNQKRLTANDATDSAPDWHPDGTLIAFCSDRDGDYDIYVMSTDGGSLSKLTDNAIGDYSPAWSPDGTKLAYARGSSIYVMDAVGDNSEFVHDGASPCWSPDGTKIALQHEGQIYVVNADGTSPMNISNNADLNSSPAWSPDGTTILYATDRDAYNWQIYAMDANGANQRGLVLSIYVCTLPAWSPDGSKFAYYSEDWGWEDIYVTNAAGTSWNRLTDNDWLDSQPDWSPTGVD
jgi:Tol biopolymer transport system component